MIYVGTSGYNYPEWRGTFYPEDFPAKDMFGYYSARFTTVEINYTFYRMPTPKTTGAWRDQAPEGFRYALKAPRRITHDKRLKDVADSTQFFCDAARVLGPGLGPLLFQLPPNLKCDVPRLDAFLETVPRDLRSAVEFRHESWHAEAVYDVLRKHGVAICIADFGDHTTPLEVTARHGYFRLRDEGYGVADLAKWASAITERAKEWDDVFVYFKHEEEGKGPEFAKVFLEQLGPNGAAGL
jgi:uncharacterized protein YecE (DUF72 family)